MEKVYLQIYSFGNEKEMTMEEKLEAAGKMGYAGVEYAGGYGGLTADEMKKALAANGLTAVSSHTQMGSIVNDLPYLAEVGVKMIICPMFPFANKAEALACAARLNQIGKKTMEHGIKVGYHNHTTEFCQDNGKYLLDYVIENTDPENVVFQLDCGWASAAGVDPVAYLQKHAGRFVSVHVKENGAVIGPGVARSATDKTPPFPVDEKGRPVVTAERTKAMEERGKLNVPTGSGIVDWKAVKAAADAQCDDVIYIVEREWSYNEPKDRIACLTADCNWLKKNL